MMGLTRSTRRALNCTARVFLVGVLTFPTQAGADPAVWLTVPNSSLEVEDGTALDLSHVTRKRAPDDLHKIGVQPGSEAFAVDGRPDPDARFFCATLAFGENTGRFPQPDEAVRWAKAIRRAGYNAVRIHMADLALMEGRNRDFDFDPDQLNRFDRLMAALRAEGIRFVIDIMGSWNGAYGDVGRNRWVEGIHDTKVGTYFPGADRDHWLSLAKLLWDRPNPFTGVSPLKDPATLGVILVNEAEIDRIGRNGLAPVFAEPFRIWLSNKYGSGAAIERAWGRPFDAAKLPGISDADVAGRDVQSFTTELQIAQIDWMRNALRGLGYDGPITNFDTVPNQHTSVARRHLSFVDLHYYADSLRNGAMVDPGATMWGGNLLDGKSRYLDSLSWARQEGQPFTVTEYGMPYWNPTRYAVAPMTAAYARFQDWKLICHYGTAIALSRPARGVWQQMLVPYNVGQDPTLRAGETISAFLFGRGDVQPSRSRLTLELSPDIAAAAPASRTIDWYTAQTEHVVGVATGWKGVAAKTDDLKRLAISAEENGIRPGPLLDRLRRAGLIAANDGTDPSAGAFRSSTGELFLDTHAERFTVVTRGSVGIVTNRPAGVDGAGWKLTLKEGAGAVFVSDLGAGDLSKSQHALLVVATDSRNTGMTFADPAETVLAKIGRFPVLIRDAYVHLDFIRPAGTTAWKLYALDFTGHRRRSLELTSTADGRLAADIRLSQLGADVTPYFELVAEDAP